MDRFQTNDTPIYSYGLLYNCNLITRTFFHLRVVLRQLFDTVNGKYQKSKEIATDSNYLRCHALLTALHFPLKTTCSCKQDTKCGTGGNNFDKWKETFQSNRPKWPERSKWTTFKAGPEYSGRTKPKRSVPFDVPTKIFKILGWKESAPYLCSFSKPLSIVFDVMGMISTQSALQVVRASFGFHFKESMGSSFSPGSIHVGFSKLIEKIWLLFSNLIFSLVTPQV